MVLQNADAEEPLHFAAVGGHRAAVDFLLSQARYEALGPAGNATRIKPIHLEDMFKRYESGELDPTVN